MPGLIKFVVIMIIGMSMIPMGAIAQEMGDTEPSMTESDSSMVFKSRRENNLRWTSASLE